MHEDESSAQIYPPCFVRKCDNCTFKDQCANYKPSEEVRTSVPCYYPYYWYPYCWPHYELVYIGDPPCPTITITNNSNNPSDVSLD